MFIVESYPLAVVFCIVTMLCWGSWGNTQKLAANTWRYELYYWDYTIGMLIFSLLAAFTLGSVGTEGRSFLTDIGQIDPGKMGSAILGGVIFNASNILLSASVSLAGMAVAFPLGVGIALVLGVIINYIGAPKGDPVFLFAGVLLVVLAVVCNGIASKHNQDGVDRHSKSKGLILALLAGILMSFLYRFVADAMDLTNFAAPKAGLATPYSAFVLFSVGVFLSNFVFNTLVMKYPFSGEPVAYGSYFRGSFSTHLVGILGGCIWALGTLFSYIAAGKAGAAVSYALGQGAPMIAALWGVFVWKEFKGTGPKVHRLLTGMFVLFILGLALIVVSGGN